MKTTEELTQIVMAVAKGIPKAQCSAAADEEGGIIWDDVKRTHATLPAGAVLDVPFEIPDTDYDNDPKRPNVDKPKVNFHSV
jgi:hypothetical protein